MILLEDILKIHKASIKDFGGAHGIRDEGLLSSALARPFQTFGGKDLYPSIFEKAAALGESLIINHPFVDGNKRTGILALLTLLLGHDIRLTATGDELYEFVINISTGSLRFEEIVSWLSKHTTKQQII
jgi:death on curing protein